MSTEIVKPIVTNENFTEQMAALANTFTEKMTEANDLARASLFMTGNESNLSSITDIAKAVGRGIGKYVLNIGDYINDTWKDGTTEYDTQIDFTHIGDVDLENGDTVEGLFTQWHYCTLFGIQFSHQRAFWAAKEGMSAGTYYFTFAQAWGNNIVKNAAVSFTLQNDVPAGGRVAGCYGAPDQATSNWKIYVFDAAGVEILEEVTPTFTETGTYLGEMKYNTRNGNLNSMQEMAYGYNRYAFSAIRQWLNSAEKAGKWWKAMDEWDIRPDQLAAKDGFLCGVSEELLANMVKVRVRTALNTNVDSSIGTYEDVYDKVFIPSLEQLYITPQISGIEGEAWDYYKILSGKATTTPQYKSYAEGGHTPTYAIESKTSAQRVRVRSAHRGASCYAWHVYSSGYVNGYGVASDAMRVAPACVIRRIA